MACNNHTLQQENDKLRELVKLYKKYIEHYQVKYEEITWLRYASWDDTIQVEAEIKTEISELENEIL